jgi:hypothetical protein
MDVENRACGWRMYSYRELRIKRLSASEEGLLLKVKCMLGETSHVEMKGNMGDQSAKEQEPEHVSKLGVAVHSLRKHFTDKSIHGKVLSVWSRVARSNWGR